jgi:transcriptional regulator with XRE-family HTH domain
MAIRSPKLSTRFSNGPRQPHVQSEGDTPAWEERLGEQVRTLRLDAGHDQATLADLADVSVTSVKNLEHGRGSSLRTLVRILRALEATSWLETLAPTPTVSPIDLLRTGEAVQRQRVSRPRSVSQPRSDV